MPDLSGACRTKRTWPLRFTQEELRQRLTPMQYHVTQERGTERYKLVFQNKPLRLCKNGDLVDVITEVTLEAVLQPVQYLKLNHETVSL